MAELMCSNYSPRVRATGIGSSAIVMWSSLAVLTTRTSRIPAFQLLAMAFTISFLLALGKWLVKRESILRQLRLPLIVWLIGLMGIFGYHFLYFTALRNATPIKASLICYLWPLLIVLFSAWLPGQRLCWWHIVGTSSGLFGTALLLIGKDTGGYQVGYRGYAAAAACALIWSSYSLLSRWKGNVPTDAIGGFCGVSALLAFLCHLFFEPTLLPQRMEWVAIIALGIGPMGIAFFAWDYGVKRGNIRTLGACSYLTPLLSTALLIAVDHHSASLIVGSACLLIVSGAVLGGLDLLRGVHRLEAECVDSGAL
jgi:drug/metabolite transporter (DMT)-like permease